MGMCKMYNLSVENLSYKWQALSYSNTNTLAIFTHQSVPDLKARLQQDQSRLNAAKQEASLRSAAGPSFGRGRGRPGGIARAPLASSLDAGLKIGPLRSGIVKSEVSAVSEPSKVVFSGPKSDEQSRKSRACEGQRGSRRARVC
jgi:DNA polymerase alpha subunit B